MRLRDGDLGGRAGGVSARCSMGHARRRSAYLWRGQFLPRGLRLRRDGGPVRLRPLAGRSRLHDREDRRRLIFLEMILVATGSLVS